MHTSMLYARTQLSLLFSDIRCGRRVSINYLIQHLIVIKCPCLIQTLFHLLACSLSTCVFTDLCCVFCLFVKSKHVTFRRQGSCFSEVLGFENIEHVLLICSSRKEFLKFSSFICLLGNTCKLFLICFATLRCATVKMFLELVTI